ncbi:hypothetical protein STSP2_00633 [Anaerohalosphaera lusitana]|uniref:DUF485 domain-containing protein n=1 Tax=Anaerohalosphaera lusitana TaxID=1936003 RepID=A0A1U9NIZ8_9BACT|nr:DUF485 domain-containing protein [Anaerohalosphaera lusitana]AQT67486.1 hypothetical protein STSP2_00633 [Anaerohalosphaera lusitana]
MADRPVRSDGTDHVHRFKQTLGIVFCAIYAVVYSSFVAISIYDITLMDTVMPFGLNLAAFFGIGLIIFALSLAAIYSRACSYSESKAAGQRDINEKASTAKERVN